MGHRRGIAVEVGHAAVAVKLGGEVELPSAGRVRHRHQALVAVDERLLAQGVINGHFHVVVAEGQGEVKVLENLAVGLDLGTVGIGFPVEVVDADLVRIGIAVEDDLVDEIGAVEVGSQSEFAPAEAEGLGQIDAVVPSLFHLGRFHKDQFACRGQHG